MVSREHGWLSVCASTFTFTFTSTSALLQAEGKNNKNWPASSFFAHKDCTGKKTITNDEQQRHCSVCERAHLPKMNEWGKYSITVLVLLREIGMGKWENVGPFRSCHVKLRGAGGREGRVFESVDDDAAG